MSPRDGLPVWLINLDRAEGRRGQMEDRLAALGLPYRRFAAVDGRADWARLAPSVDMAAFRRNTGREVLPGEIGATHSHLGVWRELIAGGAEIGLVLEDDVVFHDNFLPALDEALQIAGHWDFLKLNAIRAKQPVCQGLAGPFRLNAYLGPATGLGAYLIRRDLAERLIPAFLPIRRPIDRELDRIHVHHFRHLGLEPFPSHVDDGNLSTITGAGFAEVRKFPWYRRLPDYAGRLATSAGKAAWLMRTGQIPAKAAPLDPAPAR